MKIGICGFNCVSGLGEINRQLAQYVDVDAWLVRPHRSFLNLPDHPNVDTLHCPTGVKVEEFVKRVDVVLFCEVPLYSNLMELCKKHGKRVVCIPMQEWMPESTEGWLSDVDLFICPTRHCYDQFYQSLPCTYFPWPVDTERFRFNQRNILRRFLFIPGNGGYHGRKGLATIHECLQKAPELPIIIKHQVQENTQLYEEGDVLLCPHTCDGLGLEQMEAQACGMPTITTKGKPWDELNPLFMIPSEINKKLIKRVVDWHYLDPHDVVKHCKELLGSDITYASQAARAWAESRSWSQFGDQFTSIVKHYDALTGAMK